MSNKRKSEVSRPRQALVELMQDIHFGGIENLPVRNREPVLTPPPRTWRERKFGLPPGDRRRPAKDDFLLKAAVLELFAELDEIGDGTIAVLEVRHGLPYKVLVADPAG
jgi:hypothetical protein